MSTSSRRLRGHVAYVAHATRAIAADPYEGLERTRERAAEWRDERRPRWRYGDTEEFDRRVHEMLGAAWPCYGDGFEEVWNSALEELIAQGMEVGRSAFGGWDDGDIRLGRLAWCAARHLRPAHVVETGVARGLTTRVLLEALGRNGNGHLWSIDLPPLLERNLAAETGAAVPDPLRKHWTLVRGSSRRRLPRLIATLGQIGLFVHDSMHTTRNLSFELAETWPALVPGGAVLIDDVDRNIATGLFLRGRSDAAAAISSSADGRALIGLLVKAGARSSGGSACAR